MFKQFSIEVQKAMIQSRIDNLEGRHDRENGAIVNKLRRRLRALSRQG